jgi:hypothetical protein
MWKQFHNFRNCMWISTRFTDCSLWNYHSYANMYCVVNSNLAYVQAIICVTYCIQIYCIHNRKYNAVLSCDLRFKKIRKHNENSVARIGHTLYQLAYFYSLNTLGTRVANLWFYGSAMADQTCKFAILRHFRFDTLHSRHIVWASSWVVVCLWISGMWPCFCHVSG